MSEIRYHNTKVCELLTDRMHEAAVYVSRQKVGHGLNGGVSQCIEFAGIHSLSTSFLGFYLGSNVRTVVQQIHEQSEVPDKQITH